MGYQGEWLKVVGFGTESAFKTPTTIKEWVNRASVKFDPVIPLENVKQVVGLRELTKTYQKPIQVDGNVGFDIEPQNGMGLFLKTGFGTINTGTNSGAAGGTAYRHTFFLNQAAEIPQTLFARVPQIGTNTKDYVGLFPNKISFNFPKTENVSCAVDFLGADELIGTYQQGTFGTFAPMNTFGNLAVKIDGTSNGDITNLKCDIDFGGKKISTIGTNDTISKIVAGNLVVEGSFDIYFQDETERNKWINKTSSSLEIDLTGAVVVGTAKNELNLYLPKVEYASSEMKEEDGVSGATIAFRAQYGEASIGTGQIRAILQNAVSNY